MAVAVICEFNPFHNGHKYLLEKARSLTGKGVIAVMSGAFTQRGEVALCSKFERAKTALENGADLVAELPAAFAVANAETFARGGVGTAKLFSCVTRLAFGCETDDLSLLERAAFARDDPEVNRIIAERMEQGDYFPKANEYAVRQVLGDRTADVLTTPNNILACEYIRALAGSGIEPLPIKRKGAEHDSGTPRGDIASASYIRKLIRSGGSADAFLPEAPSEVTYPERLDAVILYKLRNMSAEEMRLLPDVSEGLENRILTGAKQSSSVEELIDRVKTKRYTRARISRIIACAVIGVTGELQKKELTHVRVLGVTPEGSKMLKTCTGQIVTSPAKIDQLDDNAAAFIASDIRAAEAAALAYDPIGRCGEDYFTKFLMVNSAK